MLPRGSTAISFQPWSATPVRSAWRTIVPSGSWRSSSGPVVSSRPSGSQSIDQPSCGGPGAITSLRPSMSTATTSSAPQWANQSRPSCQRADSTIASPSSRTCGFSSIATSFARNWTVQYSEWNWSVQYGAGVDDEPEGRTARKRRAIVEAATRAFLAGGYRGTSMDEIAAAAGVSKQTVYKQFVDKQRLFVEIV